MEQTQLGNEISPLDSVIQNETKSFELRIFKESCSTSKESSLFFFSSFYSYVIRNYCKQVYFSLVFYVFCWDNWKAVALSIF